MNCAPNTNDTFILCSSYEIKDRVKYLKVVIYELATNEVIYEPNERIRKVSWISEYEVKVDLMIGTPSDAADSDYVIYNVKTKSMKKSSIALPDNNKRLMLAVNIGFLFWQYS